MTSLILTPCGAFTPSSMMSSNEVALLGGLLLSVIVPATAYCLFVGSWFCQIHQVQSICAW